jgi:thiamine monophosphate synthase
MPSLAKPELQQALADALAGGVDALIIRPHHAEVLGSAALQKLNARCTSTNQHCLIENIFTKMDIGNAESGRPVLLSVGRLS